MSPEHLPKALGVTEPEFTPSVQNDPETDKTNGHAQITVVTAIKPRWLSKGFFLDDTCALQKLPGGNLVEGQAEIWPAPQHWSTRFVSPAVSR